MNRLFLATLIFSSAVLMSCRKPADNTEILSSDYPDWTETTHSNTTTPDYSVVFPQDKVLRFDITIDPENWEAMLNELDENFGSTSGPGGGGGGGIPGGDPAASTFTPGWQECSLFFEGREWYHVGVRFKGNSSLSSTYQQGIGKFSMKLDFDQFEDNYPALANQRFYGFKQLNLNNNFDDASLLREKIGADVFRAFGLVSAQTSFCALYVDYGDGPVYFGLYTLVEEVDDTVIDSQYDDASGNLYKPEGDAATFAAGTYNESQFDKKNNLEAADYSDVLALYEVVNSSLRTSDQEQWKNNLEAVFNVDIFLKWLAVNTCIQNWDTYGLMSHNYYLYNNPADGKLAWIPWDNNEAFQDGKMGGALSLELSEAGSNWPLIRYLIDVDEYRDKYDNYLEQFTAQVFAPASMIQSYQYYGNLIKDYAYSENYYYSFLNSPADFDAALIQLQEHVEQRNSAVAAYLDNGK